MGDKSKIEWTDATWNPVRAMYATPDGPKFGWHCEHASPGCAGCYAEAMNKWRGTGFAFKPGHLKRRDSSPHPHDKGRLPAEVSICVDDKILSQPLRWRKPRMVFVCSMTDLFADFVTDEMIDKVFAVMALCPQHTFQALTKRPARMHNYLTRRSEPDEHGFAAEDIRVAMTVLASTPSRRAMAPALKAIPLGKYCRQISWPMLNVWLGVSVEDQARADERIPDLLATPAAVRFVSYEPALGPVDWSRWLWPVHPCWPSKYRSPEEAIAAGAKVEYKRQELVLASNTFLDWIIAGGESGPNARPAHPDWFRAVRDQCAAAGTAFLFKQWGEWLPGEMFPGGTTKCQDGLPHYDSPPPHFWSGSWGDAVISLRVGKAAAGRTLDGVIHDAFPQARP